HVSADRSSSCSSVRTGYGPAPLYVSSPIGMLVLQSVKPQCGAGEEIEHHIDIGRTQIGEADDAGANLSLVAAPIAVLGNRPDELAFADRAHFLGTIVRWPEPHWMNTVVP